ncbi:hypothetical protein TrST_g10539 [Triparma strigata]|uniref:Vacuolar protein sorting-associated protein 35 n=1 Tax=Triparma strigata TaxID=1606541 RepID=A0A9W7BXZ8_9STRA|nr:hypothetical protein TrST_g10539 [Triparma strigata]
MSAQEEQIKYLTEATKKVKEHAFYMKRAIDANDLDTTLSLAADMLRELKTSLLTPRNYYELYMSVLDSLRHVEDFFASLNAAGTPVVEIYEKVQHCANVVPRLYLLIAVGGVYIKSGEAPAKDILKDLIEMVKCVQYPTRGLFLRNYLSQTSRDKLPDTGSEYEGVGGNVKDAYEFVLQNFSEMNRLWVRLQHMGGDKSTRKKREKERQDLKILVGTNLVRLSQLQGVDTDCYRDVILPEILKNVVECKDTISQGYLMDCVIQVFPDEFHLATLETFLTTCTKLKEKVNIRTILQSMMNRLSLFGEGEGRIPPDLDAFRLFNDCITKILEERSNLDLAEILRLQTSLMQFALKCYPGRLDYVNYCLGMCASVLSATKSESLDETSVAEVEELLSIPLSSLALQVLDLQQYSELLTYLPYENRRQVATILVRSTLFSGGSLDSVEKLEKLFKAITPLIKDDEKESSGAPEKDEADEAALAEFKEEQTLVARLVHMMKSPDTDVQFKILSMTRKHFGQGGVKRIGHTLPPLVFAGLKLAHKVKKRELDAVKVQNKLKALKEKQEKIEQERKERQAKKAADPEYEPPGPLEDIVMPDESAIPKPPATSCRKVFQFLHEIVTAMAVSYPDLSLKLFLQSAVAADNCKFKAIAYEFMSQAFILYEDELTDSKAQLRALVLMVGTLLSCSNFEKDDYDALITKTTQYAAKLLKKPDQCRMVTLCSHLFFVGSAEDANHYHDPKRVLECLQRALKIADGCMASSAHVHLFVEILNHYLYYFELHNPLIADKYLTGLIALINEHIDSMDHGEQRTEVEGMYRNTLRHIARKKEEEETKEKFKSIVV